MVTPFFWLDAGWRVGAFWLLAVCAVLLLVILALLGRAMKQRGADIVQFELAGTLAKAERILDDWGEVGRMHAALIQGLDYLFLTVYPLAIGLGCVLVAEQWGAPFAALGMALAWAQFGAAALDAVENYALIRLLLGDRRPRWPPLARWCALPKFVIVAAGIVYVVGGWLVTWL
jgi:hypothetical protein